MVWKLLYVAIKTTERVKKKTIFQRKMQDCKGK